MNFTSINYLLKVFVYTNKLFLKGIYFDSIYKENKLNG